MAARGEFSSRLGFVLAAAGSAVGLGNFWGFPTQVAGNGGAAFVVVYFILTFLLAYPLLMVELVIGRHTRANMVGALTQISAGPISRNAGRLVGFWGLITASLILCFYAIVAGWMIAWCLQPIASVAGMEGAAAWLTEFGTVRNLVFTAVFMVMTIGIVHGGVRSGIERWSYLLMPVLLLLTIVLIIYVATLEGAADGWRVYLMPDLARSLEPRLLVNAIGQTFFSLSLGVGTMLIYGSYINRQENLVTLGAWVAVLNTGVSILAGMLVIPAMYVALHNGVPIYTGDGRLIAEDTLIFQVIPDLFETMGMAGYFIAMAFFSLMTIAALTSSISMLEVPVSFTIETFNTERGRATWIIGLLIYLGSVLIIFNFERLFGMVVAATTSYSEPLLGVCLAVFAGWVWRRGGKLSELQHGYPGIKDSLFWRIWPAYLRYVCPLLVALVFYQSIFG